MTEPQPLLDALPDVLPGLLSAATGHHFARPGNRFWPALHRSGFTSYQLRPSEQHELPSLGLGITNVAARPTARAADLRRDELVAGGRRLVSLVRSRHPDWLAVVGVTAYRVAFAEPRAAIGPQSRTIGATRVWVLPNPSGLNAHFPPARLTAEFAALRAAVDAVDDAVDAGGLRG